MRAAALASLALGAALAAAAGGCTGSAPPPPPLTMPPNEVFGRLFLRAPSAVLEPPITLDTKSCAFALYSIDPSDEPKAFVMIHPLRTQCELWLGRTGFVLEYCLYPREELVEIDTSLRHVFRILDDEHCTFGADPPAPSEPST